MTKAKLTQLVLGGLLATGLLASSFAILADPMAPDQRIPVPHEQKQPHDMLFGKAVKKANLSSEQQAQMKQILEANKADVQKMREQMRDNQMQIHKLALSSDKGKEAKIEKLAKTQGNLVTQMILSNAKIADEMSHVLTPDQIEQLSQPAEGLNS